MNNLQNIEREYSISVIIPVYNDEQYVEEATRSALMQPETGEVLLVEDGSQDNSLQICRLLSQKLENVLLIQHEDKRNHGPGASRNLGILKARFPLISFLDADDYFLPNRFKRDIEILRSRKDVDGVFNAMGYHQTVKCESRNRNLTTMTSGVLPEELFFKMAPIGKNGHFAMGTVTVRKTIFSKTGLFETGLMRSQDTHMFIKMAAVCRLVPGVLDKAVAMRRVQAKEKYKKNDLMLSLRPLMFRKLFDWSNAKQLEKSKRIALWDQYCYYQYIRKTPKKNNMNLSGLLDLTADALKNPFLLSSRKYYRRYLQVLGMTLQGIRNS